MRYFLWFISSIVLLAPMGFSQNEVLPETQTKVVVREHPATGETYVSIVSSEVPPRDDLLSTRGDFVRPDYRLLDPNVKTRDLNYQGPYSSRKKVYILAGTLATLGTVGSMAMSVAATTGASAGGGSAFAAGSVAVTGSAAATTLIATEQDIPNDYARIQESHLIQGESDFYRIHIKGNQ